MDSTPNENDYMPLQTGERAPLPEPDDVKRIIVPKDGPPLLKKKVSVETDKPKRPLRRVAASPKRNTTQGNPRHRYGKAIEKTTKLTVLLDPELLTNFKIHALKQGLTYSKLATEAFTTLLVQNKAKETIPKKKPIRPPSSQSQERNN